MRIGYVHYGEQSGVTPHVAAALRALGHGVVPVGGFGPLDLRTERGWPRLTAPVVRHLLLAAARYGRQALAYRWCTPYAFDVHTRALGRSLRAVTPPPDVVLQNGALFAPGRPAPYPHVLLVDHTRALAERAPAPGLPRAPEWGPRWRAREGAAYRAAAAVACFSRNTARSVVEDYGADPARVVVVGAGANVFPESAPRHDDGETIAFVGREFERKGGLVLVEAFARLRRVRPRARLLVAGPVGRLSLPPGAVQLGALPYSALPALLARSTVFAMPTLLEPFGIAFLDAMACGLPCVGTRVEAVPEIVAHDATGLLVPPGDPVELAAALERLLADPGAARAMGERGRERVRTRFLWSAVGARLDAVLRRAAGLAPEGTRAAG